MSDKTPVIDKDYKWEHIPFGIEVERLTSGQFNDLGYHVMQLTRYIAYLERRIHFMEIIIETKFRGKHGND